MDHRGPFVWTLHCPACHEHFSPQEENWDDFITCMACGYKALIDHDFYGDPEQWHIASSELGVVAGADETREGEVEVEEETERPGDHPYWPSNLSDEELDRAYLAVEMVPDKLDDILEEFQRRGRKLPHGIA